jgi:hypothetical protein
VVFTLVASASLEGGNIMSALQKFAWFNLAVIAWTIVVILALLPLMGTKALGGFGFLGLLGFGYFFVRPKPGKVLIDERDELIRRKSIALAYRVFWSLFVVVAGILSARIYGQNGAVPVSVVQVSVFAALMLVMAVMSIAILVQYVGESKDAG